MAFEFEANCEALGGLAVRLEFKCFGKSKTENQNDNENGNERQAKDRNRQDTRHHRPGRM